MYRYAMEAVSSLELGGIIYPRCDQYGAGMAGVGGAGGAMAPGQHVPTGEASTPVTPHQHHLRSPCCPFILQDMCLHSNMPFISAVLAIDTGSQQSSGSKYTSLTGFPENLQACLLH